MKRMAIYLAVFGLGAGILFPQSVSMKLGLFSPRMQSDLWEINLENLTFSRSDMSSGYYSGEYEIYIDRHASFAIEIGSYAKSIYAQYRDYTFEDGSPIYQNISLRIVPIEANLKYYPIGHRHRLNPFIGAGAGVYAWTYQQWGDFINFEDDTVNEGFAETRKFGFGFNGRLGLVFRFQSRLALALEGKYLFLKGRLSEYFQGFDLLDMGGFSIHVGIIAYLR
ncbi:MAG: hypothetical protein JXO51_05455 [Candidatus Aminicenantes bacterium]|nr:hypothetical protein [Candidatus Aminicenantes bacterium]